MKQNSEVVGVFWKFKARVENESACLIQTVRSDNGKEYTSETFNRFCEEVGIEHQLQHHTLLNEMTSVKEAIDS